LIKEHLMLHPYLDLNTCLLNGIELDNSEVTWTVVGSFDPAMKPKLSALHKNQLIPDCMLQLNADQFDTSDHLGNLVVFEESTAEHPFMIVKIDERFVVADQGLPTIDDGEIA
jgi:hypothetical protein